MLNKKYFKVTQRVGIGNNYAADFFFPLLCSVDQKPVRRQQISNFVFILNFQYKITALYGE